MQLPTLVTILASALLVSAQQPVTTDTVSGEATSTTVLLNPADPQNTAAVANPTTTGDLSSTTISSTVTSTGDDGSVTTSISTSQTAVNTAEGSAAKVTGLPGVMAAAGGMVILGML